MHSLERRYILAAIAVALVIAAILAGVLVPREKPPIYIAIVGPMSGPNATDGADMLNGAQLYIEQLNAVGGIDGHPLKLVIYDDQNKADLARRRAQEIVAADQALIVIGHAFSSASIEAGRIYAQAGLPAISSSATADALTRDNEWYFRVIPDSRSQANFLATYARKVLGYDTAAIIYDQDDYGRSLSEHFGNTFKSLRGTISHEWSFDGKAEDVDSALADIVAELLADREARPDVIFLATHANEAVELAVRIRRKGLAMPLMGASALANVTFIQRFNQHPEEQASPGYFSDGIYVAAPILFDVAGEEAQRFRNAFIARYGYEPGMKAATTYDALKVAVYAMRAVHATGDEPQRASERRRIRDELAGLTNIRQAVDGVTGSLYFDTYGNVVKAIAVGVYRRQHLISPYVQLQPITDFDRIPDLQVAIDEGRVLVDSISAFYRTNIVYTGVNINEVSNLDIKDETYTVDFYLWFRYQGAFDDSNIEFLNAAGALKLGEPVVERSTDAYTYRAYRLKGTFRNQFDFGDYPFDRQNLVIRFRHADMTRENLIYVRDTLGMSQRTTAEVLAKFAHDRVFESVDGWFVTGADFYQDIMRSDSTLGDPRLFDSGAEIEHSRFNVVIHMRRDGLRFVLKNLFPLLILTVISYLVFFIPPRQLAVTNGLLRSALLAVAFFHQRLSNALPGIDYFIALDAPFYVFYILTVLTLILTTTSHKADAQGQQTRVRHLTVLGRTVYPLIVLGSTIFFIYRYDVFDMAALRAEQATSASAVAPATTETLIPSDEAITHPAFARTPLAGTELHILQWKHFIPGYDAWFDAFVADWGATHGVRVTVDHVDVAELLPQLRAELEAGEGHDLVELLSPAAQFEPYVVDLTDVNLEAQARFGPQIPLCTRSSYNPTTDKWYGFCHGWVPDPGNYRRTLWAQAGMPDGPRTYADLLNVGARLERQTGVPVGLGLSEEIDSNLAVRAILWSFGASVQDENENVVINSPQTIAALNYMADLYHQAMGDEIFNWTAASNNQGLLAGELSYILNAISAYRTAQTVNPDVADDIAFVPALTGPDGLARVGSHGLPTYVVPRFSDNAPAAKNFLLHLVTNYEQATYNSQLFTFPAWKRTVPELYSDGGWLDRDPFGSRPADKLAVLKEAEQWTVNIGYPGPANAAVAEVFARSVLPRMAARVARGEVTAAEAVADAEREITAIFEKWREAGLVGGEP